MTFDDFEMIFDRLACELEEAAGESFAGTFTWYARTSGELDEEMDLPGSAYDRDGHIKEGRYQRIGAGEPVAWAYECNGPTLAAIGSGATPEQVKDLLRGWFNLDEADPTGESEESPVGSESFDD